MAGEEDKMWRDRQTSPGKNRAGGEEKMAGTTKEGLGKLIGDDELEAEGKGEHASGTIQEAADKLKEEVKGRKDGLTDK